jgi:tRNA-splicing ligase RtcB
LELNMAIGASSEPGPGGAGLVQQSPFRWILPRHGNMRVPGVVFASASLLPGAVEDRSIWQLANVATLPGIVKASYAMPDIHWGYGFPIGGVAATDVAAGGVVSPGGVGFDISCGVRLLATPYTEVELRPRLGRLMVSLERRVPSGTGAMGVWRVDERMLRRVLRAGARAAVEEGYGVADDLARCEDGGALPADEAEGVSRTAITRGLGQLGSLGSGNHFVEIQAVERILDPEVAHRFGLRAGQVTVMIHTGSRGFGHQVCSDHVREMLEALPAYRITLPDPQLAAAPVDSPHGRRYLSAMAAAANFGRANRQLIAWSVREVFREVMGEGALTLVYDVSHNLAKLEQHDVGGRRLTLCVHRKGATRALAAGHPDLPPVYRDSGQPVLVPGSMGTASYVLVGGKDNEAFASTCHGAGRTMSRHAAMRGSSGVELRNRLRREGITVKTRSLHSLPEESPEAYKDVDEVVRVCDEVGLSRPVARLRPLAVLKG